MRKVGEILRQTRIKKSLDLKEIEKITKIRSEFLKAIEENDFSKIPQATTTKGFIRNYASALGINSEGILAVFRRDFSENEKGQIVPRGMVAPIDRFKFSWNPKLTLLFTVSLVIFVFFGFLLKQYLSYVSSPKIIIAYPPEGQIISKNEVEFFGKVDKDASFYINGEIVNLGPAGEYKKKVVLAEGENEIILEAVSRKGAKTRVIRKVKFLH